MAAVYAQRKPVLSNGRRALARALRRQPMGHAAVSEWRPHGADFRRSVMKSLGSLSCREPAGRQALKANLKKSACVVNGKLTKVFINNLWL